MCVCVYSLVVFMDLYMEKGWNLGMVSHSCTRLASSLLYAVLDR
jgi:hypothetical protein